MRNKAFIPSLLFWVGVLTFVFFNTNVYVNFIVFLGGMMATMMLYAYLEEKKTHKVSFNFSHLAF